VGGKPCFIRLSRGYFPTGFTYFPHCLFIFSSLLIFLKLTATAAGKKFHPNVVVVIFVTVLTCCC
jgi:hypothetical protein